MRAAAIAGPYGARSTPASVMMPAISEAGVTSKAGLWTRRTGAATYNSPAARCSISIASPEGVAGSSVEHGPAT